MLMVISGGTNPAIRTLFYRLVRLLAAPIQPIFVFDGPHKPAVKRNKRSGRGDGVSTALAKRLIRLFGFAYHDAPGEAEAECALLQRNGIVDAVLSEDVDTIMFGCTKTIRNWSGEKKSAKPTHVSVYDTKDKELKKQGLDREGMVLVALMSGGDYLPDGIPGCGIKVACEAARAGFGKTLCRLKTSDKVGLLAWKLQLSEELRTNESGYFRTKHASLALPDSFPDMDVLRLYTHPVVSPIADLGTIRSKLSQPRSIDLDSLREFCRENFDWDYRGGAFKFIKVLSDALLVQQLRQRAADGDDGKLVKQITKRRTAFTTDMTPELRLTFIPEEVVPIDYSQEVVENIAYGREGLALNSDDEAEPAFEDGNDATQKEFDPSKPCLTWVLEVLAQQSIPTAINAWEEEKAAKALRKSPKKAAASKSAKSIKANMPHGAIEGFVRVTKKVTETSQAISSKSIVSEIPSSPPPSIRSHTPPSKHRTPQAKKKQQSGPSSRLPGTNRSTIPNSSSEPILIASSPPTSPASPPKPSRADTQSVSPQRPQVPRSIRSIAARQSIPVEVNKLSKPKAQPSSQLSSSPARQRFKQTTLSSFTAIRQPSLPRPSKAPEEPLKKPVRTVDDSIFDSDSDLEPISSMTARLPSSPTKRRSKAQEPTSSRDASPIKSSPCKKKLLIPDSKGVFTEIEVNAEDRDAIVAQVEAKLKASGSKSRVARLSDLSVIDLTQYD